MNKTQVVSSKPQVVGGRWYAILIIFILHSSFIICAAQTTNRVELPILRGSDTYHTVSLGAEGVLLITQLSRTNFILQKFNTDLAVDWKQEVTIENGLDFVKSSYDGHSVYLLFSRTRTDFYQVVKVNVGPGYIENFYLTAVDRFEITDFEVLGYSVYMAGTVRNEPLLLYTNVLSKQSKVLPGVSLPNSVIQSIEADTVHHVVNVCFAARKGREIKLVSKSFDELGQAVGQVMIEPENDYSLINGRLFILNDSTKMMVGTYGFRNMQGNGNSASQGVFISKIMFDEVEFTQYHSFTDFKNFFAFMSDRQRERIEKRIERKKESGGDIKLNYQLLVHDIVPQGDNFLITAEVFYPEYRNNNTSMYGMNSAFGSSFMSPMMFGRFSSLYNPYMYNPWYNNGRNNGQIFTGFVYTHAIITSFDKDGKLLWDNSLPFESVKTMELKEKAKVKVNGDGSVALSYSNNGTITSKTFNQGIASTDRTMMAISTDDSSDKVRNTSTDDVLYWFGNYYLAYGFQKIVGADGRRNVFYMNKISF
jgi:hypothetical protein